MNEPSEDIKKEFEDRFDKIYKETTIRSTLLLKDDYIKLISEVKEAQELRRLGKPLSSKHYRRLSRYDLLNIGEDEKLIAKRYSNEEDIKLFVYREQLFNILHTTHITTGHKKEKGMEQELRKNYANITREIINMYLSICRVCQLKKSSKRALFMKPISKYMNCRCQVDLIDMQTEPNGPYNFILNYQDHVTKFVFLRPLKTKTAHEVADHLVDIFCLIGSPYILHSDHGSEFDNSLIRELTTFWPSLKIVRGEPRHSQSRCSIKRATREIRDMLTIWLNDNNSTKWSEGLRFIQSQKNRSFHRGISKSPFEAMFGTRQVNGLGDADLPRDILNELQNEVDLERLINGMENEQDDDSLQNEETTESKKNIETSDDGSNNEIKWPEELKSVQSQKNRTFHREIGESPCEAMFDTQQVDSLEDADLPRDVVDKLQNEADLDRLIKSIKSEHDDDSLQNEEKTESGNNKPFHEYHIKVENERMETVTNENRVDNDETASVVAESSIDWNLNYQLSQRNKRNEAALPSEVSDNSLYKITTENDALDPLFSGNELFPADSHFTSQSNNINFKRIPFRTTTKMSPKSSRQDFLRCKCKRFCADKKCSCKQRNKTCGSKCHGSLICMNK